VGRRGDEGVKSWVSKNSSGDGGVKGGSEGWRRDYGNFIALDAVTYLSLQLCDLREEEGREKGKISGEEERRVGWSFDAIYFQFWGTIRSINDIYLLHTPTLRHDAKGRAIGAPDSQKSEFT
jgi:hypothetical protein